MHTYIKWFLIVAINSISGFVFGLNDQGLTNIPGMVAGILTWYFIYLNIDLFLLRKGHKNLSKKLFISAIIRAPLQLFTLIDLFAGIGAMQTVQFLGLDYFGGPFFSAYSLTIFTGLYLSVICSAIFLAISIFEYVFLNRNKEEEE